MAGHGQGLAGAGALHPVAEALAELVRANDSLRDRREAALPSGLSSGAEGARTPDLRHAMAALSQLSYSPSEIDVVGKGNTRLPGITQRSES